MVFCCFSIQKEGIGLIVRLLKCSPAKEINQRGGVICEIGNAMAHFFKSLSLGALMNRPNKHLAPSNLAPNRVVDHPVDAMAFILIVYHLSMDKTSPRIPPFRASQRSFFPPAAEGEEKWGHPTPRLGTAVPKNPARLLRSPVSPPPPHKK